MLVMMPVYQFLLTIGGLLLVGLVTSTLGRKTVLPRVTLLLLLGAVIGREALDVIPVDFTNRFELIADMALLMVGFLLGGRLHIKSLRHDADKILWISVTAAVMTAVLVGLGLFLAGVTVELAILLGCIASATAPAAILDVVMESGCKGRFRDLLLSIVAIDDAWALILFGFGLAIVTSLHGAGSGSAFVLEAVREIGGAVLLGVVLGLPAAYLTGRLKKGQPMLTEALGIVFLCGGLAIWLNVSFLIAAMVMGAVISNLARHHDYPFHAIEGVEWPFMVIFFVLAGASLEFGALKDIGMIGMVYVLCRSAGKILGARIGSRCCHVDKPTRDWMGVALLPQAGVAIGMALVAAGQFPRYGQTLLSLVISTTVFFEIIGPVFTRLALRRAGST